MTVVFDDKLSVQFPSLYKMLDGMKKDQIRFCWSPFLLGSGGHYQRHPLIPEIKYMRDYDMKVQLNHIDKANFDVKHSDDNILIEEGTGKIQSES